MKLLFFIRNIAFSRRTTGWEHDPRERSTHELLFCRSGEGTLVTGTSRTQVQAGSLMFNPRGKLVSARNALSVVQVLFSEQLFSPSVHMDKEALYVLGIIKLYAQKQNHLTLSRIGTERVASLVDAMLWEFQNRYRGYSWALRLKLIELLITVMRDTQFKIPIKGLKPLSSTRIQDAISYLNTEYMNPVSVEDVLRSCGVSRSHFHALFKQETGTTFVQYLSALRCAKAGELLVTTDRPIVDIALECGFRSLSHFYHVFKREKHMSPKNYRVQVGATP